MKSRSIVWVGWGLLLAPFVLFTLALVDWRPSLEVRREKIGAFAAKGPLKVGAAALPLALTGRPVLGGFATRGDAPSEGALDELKARAVVVAVGERRLGLVSLETVVVTEALRRQVIERTRDLKLDDVLVGATHTHAGPGGFWDSRLASWMGLGPFDPSVERQLVDRIAEALRFATETLRPANVAVGSLETSRFGANRHEADGAVDARLTAVKFVDDGERTLARLVLLGIHPTILPESNHQLSGDWPGALMRSLEADDGVTLFWQGAGGDTTWAKRKGSLSPAERVEAFGAAVASEARGALALAGTGRDQVVLRHGRVRLWLPAATDTALAPRILEPVVDNVLHLLAHPGTTEVSYTELGPLRLAAVPAEPVAALGLAWREALDVTAVAGLVDAYVGYVETPERVKAEVGEAKRTYFGPTLADDLRESLKAARQAADAERIAEDPAAPVEGP